MGYADKIVLNELYRFIYERKADYTPDRLPSGTQQAYEGSGGKKLKRATEIAYRSHQAIPKNSGAEEFADNPDRKQRRIGKNRISSLVKPIEAKYLREWANKHGLMLNNNEFTKKWIEQGRMGETENENYFDEASQRWFKRNNLIYHSNYLEFFYRMALHNQLFPEAPLTLEGFVETEDGLSPVISQPNVAAKKGASRDVVMNHMKRLGYDNIPNTDDYINRQNNIKIEDLHDENVLVGDDGLLYVIDPVIFLDEDGKMQRISQDDPISDQV